MSDRTGIQWTEATWNPVVGCTKVSAGCDHCYAIRDAARLQHTSAYAGTVADGDWTGLIRCPPERLTQPLRWQKPRRIFVNSMSDLFHDSVPDGFIAAVWYVMGQCAGCIPEQYRGHVFQILTKRPGRMAAFLRRWADIGDPQIPPMDPAAQRCGRAQLIAEAEDVFGAPIMYDWMDGPRYWPAELPGVWLGTSIEDQRWADIRVPKLLECPAEVRFLSCEPLLGPVDLTPWLHDSNCVIREEGCCICAEPREAHVNWVIVGGESGPGARPMHPQWARDLRDQCQAAGVAFFMKQQGAWRYVYEADSFKEEQAAKARSDHAYKEHPWRSLEVAGSFVNGPPTQTCATVSRYGGHNDDPTGWPADLRVRQYPDDEGRRR
jgi:protein gp37